MINASKEFVEMLVLAGASALLSPASFGLSAVGTVLALGTAGYILIAELKPLVLKFLRETYYLMGANWIFTMALSEVITETFETKISTNLNLKPAFRSILPNDVDVSTGTAHFIDAMSSLGKHWNKVAAVFGNLPSYENTQEPTTIVTEEISISNISNANVKYLGNIDQSIRFESLSGNEKKFTYHIRISKEGFVEERTMTGTVIPPRCDIDEILGTWLVQFYNTCYPNPDGTPALSSTKATLTLSENGVSLVRYDDGSETKIHGHTIRTGAQLHTIITNPYTGATITARVNKTSLLISVAIKQ